MDKERREDAYRTLTSLIGDMTTHADLYRGMYGNPDRELEYKIHALFAAKEIVRDYVDPCDIPF